MKEKLIRYADKLNLPRGKTIVITGGNSGIGFSVAKHLIHYDYRIIVAVRNRSRGEKAKEELLRENPDARIEVWDLELSNFESMRAFVKRIQKEHLDIDCFYSNAGVYRIPFALGELGIEMTLLTNYVSNLYLYLLLKEYLLQLGHPVKFILTSSMVARFAHMDVSDFDGHDYQKMKFYKKSKVAVNQLYRFMVEDAKGTNLLPLLVHPGSTYTPLIAKAYPNRTLMIAAQRFMRIFFHSPDKAALCTLALLSEEIDTPTFMAPRGIFHISGYPKKIKLYQGNLAKYKETIAYTRDMISEYLR